MTQWIEDSLRELGITPKYVGFRRTVLSISRVLEDENRLREVVKQIYHVVGDMDHCTWTAVECTLRTVVAQVWAHHAKRLCEMAGYTLPQAPTNADFLDIMSNYVRRTYLIGTNGREHL